MNQVLRLLSVAVLCIAASHAHAQGGGVFTGQCTNSPENPTAILGLIGFAGAAATELRGRLRRRLKEKR